MVDHTQMSFTVHVLGGSRSPDVRALIESGRANVIAPAQWRVDPATGTPHYGPRADEEGAANTFLVVFPDASEDEKAAVVGELTAAAAAAAASEATASGGTMITFNYVSPAALRVLAEGGASLLGARLRAHHKRLVVSGLSGLNGRSFPLAEWAAAFRVAHTRPTPAGVTIHGDGGPSLARSAATATATATAAATTTASKPQHAAATARRSATGTPNTNATKTAACAPPRKLALSEAQARAGTALVVRMLRRSYPEIGACLSSGGGRLLRLASADRAQLDSAVRGVLDALLDDVLQNSGVRRGGGATTTAAAAGTAKRATKKTKRTRK